MLDIMGIHHFNFTVHDLDVTIPFYVELLGFRLRSRGIYEYEEAYKVAQFRDRTIPAPGQGLKLDVAVLELRGFRVEFVQYLVPRSAPYAGDPSVAGSFHLGLRVRDIEAVRERLKLAGVDFAWSVMHFDVKGTRQPWKYCYFWDPDHIQVELVEEVAPTDVIESIGRRIKETRIGRGLSLTEVAKSSGISAPHLSQVEKGESVPSIPSLVSISASLGLVPDYFLRLEEADLLPRQVHKGHPKESTVGTLLSGSGQAMAMTGDIQWHWLTARGEDIEVVKYRYGIGASTEVHGEGAEGREVISVLNGIIQVDVDSSSELLVAGNSITHDRSVSRRIVNTGTEPAEVLQVIVTCDGEGV